MDVLADLPGAELILKGLQDYQQGQVSAESLLVEILSPHLKDYDLLRPFFRHAPPPCDVAPELQLYRWLCTHECADAYSRYNALRRRADRFRRALTQRMQGHALDSCERKAR